MVNLTSNEALPLMIVSIPMPVIAIIFSLWGGIKSYQYTKKNSSNNSKYFQYNAILSNLFNCISCICVCIYLIWITFYPLNNEDFFLMHTSIRLRIATTASWYVAKIFLFLIFNGRLFYAFRNSKYRSNKKLFKFLNWFVFLHAIISLIIGYIGVMILRNEIVANIGFNTFHFNLAILLFYLSVQFNRRMFYLSTTRVKIELSRSHNDPKEFVEFSSITTKTINSITTEHETTPTESTDIEELQCYDDDDDDEAIIHKEIINKEKKYRRHIYREDSIVSNREFLRIVTRSTLLLTWIIPFMISISLTWSLHRFFFNTSHYSMCIALIVMSLDAFIDIICVLLLFKYCDPFYNGLCRCIYTNISCQKLSLDWFCAACCHKLAKKYVD